MTILSEFVHWVEPALPFAAMVLSATILFGCAVASWVAPSEKTDCIFHREVI